MYYISYKDPGLFQANHQFDGFKIMEIKDISELAEVCKRYVWSPIKWKFGVRKQVNFESASLCVFDFDYELTLEEAKENVFADCICLIATTKSHQKQKGERPPMDRFRVVVPFERNITDLDEYRFTMRRHARVYDSDQSCIDGARFFWPHEETEIWINEDGWSKIDVYSDPPNNIIFTRTYKADEIPFWAGWFLKTGELCRGSGGRNDMIMRISKWAKDHKWPKDKIMKMVLDGKFDRTDMPDWEIQTTISKIMEP